MFVAQVISVILHMFLKMDCVPILKYLSKNLFIFKINLLDGRQQTLPKFMGYC